MEAGTRVKVFKDSEFDIYHRNVVIKTGTIVKEYPRFYLVLLDGGYKECFYKNEVFRINEDIKPEQKRIIRI